MPKYANVPTPNTTKKNTEQRRGSLLILKATVARIFPIMANIKDPIIIPIIMTLTIIITLLSKDCCPGVGGGYFFVRNFSSTKLQTICNLD